MSRHEIHIKSITHKCNHSDGRCAGYGLPVVMGTCQYGWGATTSDSEADVRAQFARHAG